MNRAGLPVVVGVGPVLVDHFVHAGVLEASPDLPNPGDKLEARDPQHMARVRREYVEAWSPITQVGGPVYVALRQAKALGAVTYFVGTVGSDDMGTQILETMVDQGFATNGMIVQQHRRSGSAVVWIDPRGERSILFDSGRLEYLPEDAALALLKVEPDVVHIDSRQPHAALGLARAAQQAGITVHYDIDPWNEFTPALLEYTNVAQVSLRELRERQSHEDPLVEARRIRAEFDLDLCIVTMGQQGLRAVAKDGTEYKIPAIGGSRAVDSTGAGDAFAGAYEMARLQGRPIDEALREACAAGAFMSQNLGNLNLARPDDLVNSLEQVPSL